MVPSSRRLTSVGAIGRRVPGLERQGGTDRHEPPAETSRSIGAGSVRRLRLRPPLRAPSTARRHAALRPARRSTIRPMPKTPRARKRPRIRRRRGHPSPARPGRTEDASELDVADPIPPGLITHSTKRCTVPRIAPPMAARSSTTIIGPAGQCQQAREKPVRGEDERVRQAMDVQVVRASAMPRAARNRYAGIAQVPPDGGRHEEEGDDRAQLDQRVPHHRDRRPAVTAAATQHEPRDHGHVVVRAVAAPRAGARWCDDDSPAGPAR